MRTRQSVLSSLSLFAAVALLAGCAGRKPVETVAKAELAIDHAAQGNAAVYAPTDLQLAQDKLSSARRAMDRNDNEEARRLADEALVYAQLAEAKAKSEQARMAAAETRRNIDALRTQTTTTAVVVEKQSPSKVVVERSNAPDLVIERQPAPAQVTIERRPATAVVVEPNPSVVIESR